MSWVVYIISFITLNVGVLLVRHDEPIWGGLLLGLALALAHLSGVMKEIKRNNQ